EYRAMLPANAPSADVSGPAVFSLSEVSEGTILVTDASLRQVLRRAQKRDAAAVLSCSLESFNTDPSGQRRHMRAVQYTSVREGTKTPVAQVTPGLVEGLRRADAAGQSPILHLVAEVHIEERPLRTLRAAVRGAESPNEAVVIASHVQEPGACDNASGVAGLLEGARNLAELIQSGELATPRRSLVFLWGDEFRQSEAWLEATERRAVGAISSDMTGQSKEKTGAIALLERTPDPGALVPLPPDEHTPWGAGAVDAEDLSPNGLAIMARCAMADVARAAGSWETAEHPWEGGSDHDVFLERGIPALLIWHFTDFAYHTSLDRLSHVDLQEMRRTGVAIMATGLALADPRPEDLERYLKTLDLERNLRVAAAVEQEDADTAAAWRAWSTGARHWLRAHCLNLNPPTRGTK
ncbi:MAG: M28 family peptidase, partial [Planctomycetota bacterium]|nr:M28 family peptidase [Planctomycetota bacterium]